MVNTMTVAVSVLQSLHWTTALIGSHAYPSRLNCVLALNQSQTKSLALKTVAVRTPAASGAQAYAISSCESGSH